MKRLQLRWIFGLTALATIAIVSLQVYIWNQGIRQERSRLSRALHHAVFEATEEFMQPFETEITIAEGALTDSFGIRQPGLIALQIGRADTNFSFRIKGQIDEALHRQVVILDTTSQVEPLSEVIHARHRRAVTLLPDSVANNIFVRHRTACPSCKAGFTQLSSDNFKPLLETELSHLDIDEDFHWGVRHLDNWLIVEGDTSALDASPWQIPFFTFPVGSMEHTWEMQASTARAAGTLEQFIPPTIYLHFPNENWLLVRNFGPTLLTSSLLALLVLGCIGYALYVILQQKQLSEVKTDFINNMTHELKTPISTIALACEAMQDADVSVPVETRRHYLKMIAAENDRLASQVEKVLQMAMLDKKDLGLNMEAVNVHFLLSEIIEAFSLQLKQRSGQVSLDLKAEKSTIEGDQLHLRQMFANLLDNANKYSPNSPDIRIETKSVKTGIEIAFHDRGIGIQRDALRKIFNRFYRVPTGNLHDVKGFGLGLSYVQTMAIAHGGHISASSKPGDGSSFYLFLPYANA